MARGDLPPLRRPPEESALTLLGTHTPDGWEYACATCNTQCVVRRRWARYGNKHNGWGVYRHGGRSVALCPRHAVAETRRRAHDG